jgi:hypothetical protein
MGEGFTWETQDRARDIAAAERAWAKSLELMADASFSLVILDELNIALRYEYLDLAAVVAALAARRDGLHVVVTGCNAKPELIAAAGRPSPTARSSRRRSIGWPRISRLISISTRRSACRDEEREDADQRDEQGFGAAVERERSADVSCGCGAAAIARDRIFNLDAAIDARPGKGEAEGPREAASGYPALGER